MVTTRSEKPYTLHPIPRKFLQNCLWSSSTVRLIFQERSSSVSSFHAPLLQAIDGVRDVLGFVPAGSVSSSSTLQIFREASHLWGLLFPPVCLLGHFPSLRHVQDSAPTGVFEGRYRPLTHSSLGFPFHFSLFVASSLNLWGWWHVSETPVRPMIQTANCQLPGRMCTKNNTYPKCYFCFKF